jgi:hypothetical protein
MKHLYGLHCKSSKIRLINLSVHLTPTPANLLGKPHNTLERLWGKYVYAALIRHQQSAGITLLREIYAATDNKRQWKIDKQSSFTKNEMDFSPHLHTP